MNFSKILLRQSSRTLFRGPPSYPWLNYTHVYAFIHVVNLTVFKFWKNFLVRYYVCVRIYLYVDVPVK